MQALILFDIHNDCFAGGSAIAWWNRARRRPVRRGCCRPFAPPASRWSKPGLCPGGPARRSSSRARRQDPCRGGAPRGRADRQKALSQRFPGHRSAGGTEASGRQASADRRHDDLHVDGQHGTRGLRPGLQLRCGARCLRHARSGPWRPDRHSARRAGDMHGGAGFAVCRGQGDGGLVGCPRVPNAPGKPPAACAAVPGTAPAALGRR